MIMDLLVANMIANDKNDSWNKQTIIIYQAYFIRALNIIYKKIFYLQPGWNIHSIELNICSPCFLQNICYDFSFQDLVLTQAVLSF